MKKITCILSAVVLALTLWAVALWLLPFGDYNDNVKETRYGMKGQRIFPVGNTVC